MYLLKKNSFYLRMVLFGASILFFLSVPVLAHHILGIPHYNYDKDYPQAPVLKLTQTVGAWEFQVTGYPGKPQPGIRTQINVYVVHKKSKELYSGKMNAVIIQRTLMGIKKNIYGPTEGSFSENVFKFYPTYPNAGNYELTLSFQDRAIVSKLTLPLVVGNPGSPWETIFWFFGGLGVFLIIVRALLIKRRRHKRAELQSEIANRK